MKLKKKLKNQDQKKSIREYQVFMQARLIRMKGMHHLILNSKVN